MELSWPPSLTCNTEEKRKDSTNMETDVVMLDDPPQKDGSSRDPEKNAELSNNNKEPATVEVPEQLPDGLCIKPYGPDELYTGKIGTGDHQKAQTKSLCKIQQGPVLSKKVLSFCCSECKGPTTYSPNNLLKHFQGSHKGTLPTYPCDLCSFVTNEFSSFQRHRIVHRDPQVTCEICNDGVKYSLLLLTRHYTHHHSQNGHFNCEKCEFSTRDAGTFVQHHHHHHRNEERLTCAEFQHVGASRREHQRHISDHSATFPFTCQFCGYGATRKDYIAQHMATSQCEEGSKMEEKPFMNSLTGLKVVLKRSPATGGSREPQWMSKIHNLPSLLDQTGSFYNPEKTLEETQQFLERAVRVKKENSLRLNSSGKMEPQCSYPVSPTPPRPNPPETDASPGSALHVHNNNNGLSVLMVKNKISIPPNCTTKVMGFKMVDGKKHLVLKVIPKKQDLPTPSEGSTTAKEMDSQSHGAANESAYDGEKLCSSPCSAMSSPIDLRRPDSVESSTAGELNDLALRVPDTEKDIIDLSRKRETVGSAEQCRKYDKVNCTLQQEKYAEPRHSPLPTSQCESPLSLTTKESKTSVQQCYRVMDAENSWSCDSPPESAAEESHLDKHLDSSENRIHSAHSKVTDSDSHAGIALLVDTFAKATILPDPVTGALSDSSEDVTMPSHSTENDLSPSKSIEVSVVDSELAQSCSVTNTPGDAATDHAPYSTNSTNDKGTLPNSFLIPLNLMLKGKFSDLAEVKNAEDSIENEVTSVKFSTLSECHEEVEVLNSLEPNPRLSETNDNIGKSVNSIEETVKADVDDIDCSSHIPEISLPSTVDSLANSLPEVKPLITVDAVPFSSSAEDKMERMDGVNGSSFLDIAPVASNKPTLLPPHHKEINDVEKVTSPKTSPMSNIGLTDCEMSDPVPVHKDASNADTCVLLGSGEPLKIKHTSLSCVKNHFPEYNHTDESKCFSDEQNSITSKNHSSANGQVTTKPLKSPSAQHTPSTNSSKVFTHDEPVLPTPAKMDSMNVSMDSDEEFHSPLSSSQQVFSFHNYSKEAYSSLIDCELSGEQSASQAHEAEEAHEEDCADFELSSDWRLALESSPTPPQATRSQEEEADECDTEAQWSAEADPPTAGAASLERVSDHDIVVDECIAGMDESSVTVEKQADVLSAPPCGSGCNVEEPSTSFGQKGPEVKNNVGVLGEILEKHSEAIINQQLEKEGLVTHVAPAALRACNDSVKRIKTTLKILKTSEGKQKIFLQTPDKRYAVPVQLASGPGFQLITKSSRKVNVSYVQPGIDRRSKTTGLALTSGKPGVGCQALSGGDKAPMTLSPLQLGSTSSGGHYLLNAGSVSSPFYLSGAITSSTGNETTPQAPTYYVLQTPVPVNPSTSRQDPGFQTQQISRPVFAVPVTQTGKTSPVKAGFPTYLLRYLSPAKSGILLGNAEGNAAGSNMLSSEGGKNKLVFKVIRNANGCVTSSLCKNPIYLTTGGLQSPCFIMSSNKSVGNASASNLQHGRSQQPATLSQFSNTHVPQVTFPENSGSHKKSHHVTTQKKRKRKKHRKDLIDDTSESWSKARRLSGRTEREEPTEWAPVPKDVERTLRLHPFSAFQLIKIPRPNQPVVVLNHPDAHIPEVADIMETVNKHEEVEKVRISKTTDQVLQEVGLPPGGMRPRPSTAKSSTTHGSSRARRFASKVRERFDLRITLKKTGRTKYEVLRKSASSSTAEQTTTFSCWFCGRIFNNQEDWVGHGQRHLMEATRDWNFKSSEAVLEPIDGVKIRPLNGPDCKETRK